MGTKYHDGIDSLKDSLSGIKGEWTELSNNAFQFRSSKGGVLVYYPSTGTLQFQGSKEMKSALEIEVSKLLAGNGSDELQKDLIEQARSQQTIFVVHGHDLTTKDQLELFLRRLNLKPYILMNSSGHGKTIIEALEAKIGKDSRSDFGIVIFTPDDLGYSKKESAEKAEPRARQNVVLEAGMLISSVSRERMAILVKGHVVLPSDLQGMIELRFNDHISEIGAKLASRLDEAGIEYDKGKLSEAIG